MLSGFVFKNLNMAVNKSSLFMSCLTFDISFMWVISIGIIYQRGKNRICILTQRHCLTLLGVFAHCLHACEPGHSFAFAFPFEKMIERVNNVLRNYLSWEKYLRKFYQLKLR